MWAVGNGHHLRVWTTALLTAGKTSWSQQAVCQALADVTGFLAPLAILFSRGRFDFGSFGKPGELERVSPERITLPLMSVSWSRVALSDETSYSQRKLVSDW